MNKKYHLCVVGDGLMSNLLIQRYFQSFPDHSVLQVSAQDLAPTVSEISTAVVAKRNVQKGLSELGDKLYDAHDAFLNYFKCYDDQGIEKCIHESRCSLDSEKVTTFQKRFPDHKETENYLYAQEEGHLFYPSKFLNELREKSQTYKIERVRDFIYQQAKGKLIGKEGIYQADKIFLGLGPYSARLQKLIEYPISLKEVRGSYLKFPYVDEESFSYTIDGLNLIYRKKDESLIFGNSQFEGAIGEHDFSDLCEKYSHFKIEKDLPDLSKAEYCSGFRSKASKRLPHWGENQLGNFYATGFWKNGYTLSFLAANQLVKSWESESVN